MATYTKQKLSGSTNGLGILVAQNATPGTAIHTAINNETDWDEVWIYWVTSSASDVKLTIEWGYGDSSVDEHIEKTILAESGLYCVIPGLILQNSALIKAFAGTASVLVIHGFVNRITA
jgi:hypothetical protein